MADASRKGRNIGEIPPVADPVRRRAAAASLRLFCETYASATFELEWSNDHLEVIAKIEESVLKGGLFANAMPRGSGKTSLCEIGSLWASLNGHRDFIVIIGSDASHAEENLSSIKTEFESNELLEADYPEVCLPIVKLEGIANRCSGQLYNDVRTHIEWTAKEIVLPSLKPIGWPDMDDHRDFVRADGYSLASGVIMKVAGITGGIRGMKHKRADGKSIRPSLVLLDDPQTDESARSASQCQTRERVISGAVLGLAGPGKKIAGLMACTVVAPGDMADSILNRDKHPRWNGTRTKIAYALPTNAKLWERYKEILDEGLKAGRGNAEATEFYRRNREEMDAGAIVAWPQRFNPDEISAVQHVMTLKLQDERTFWAEYMNEPLPDQDVRSDDLTADQVSGKINRIPRGVVPAGANRLTAFVDVHNDVLYYAVAAWEDDFTGYVVDYGTYPEQRVPYFLKRDAKVTLATLFPSAGVEERIYAGLTALCESILGRDWETDGGAALKVERCLIDANWSKDVVNQFCRQSRFTAVLTPSHGKFIGASAYELNAAQKRPSDRIGLNWRSRPVPDMKSVRYLTFDTNFWKNFVHARLSVGLGGRGCLSLFGDKPETHRLFADHFTAEYRVRVESRGRTVDEWKPRPERFDNHFLDCITGVTVAASVEGVTLAETVNGPVATKRKTFGASYFGRPSAG